MFLRLLIFINIYSISTISIGYISNGIYTPYPIGINASYTYNYSIDCAQCLCHAFKSNISYATMNCLKNSSQCIFYKNFTTNYSLDININSSIYLFQSLPSRLSMTTMKYSTYESTQTSQSTTISSITQIASTMSPCAPGFIIITFDDIFNASSSLDSIPSPYQCFNWVNAGYLNVTALSSTNAFQRALVSGTYVAFNRNGTSMNMTRNNSSFHIHSFVVSAAFRDPLNLLIKGIRNDNSIAYQQDLLVNTSYARTITLNWFNLTTVNFQTYFHDSSSDQNYTGLGQQFSMDNLIVTLN